MLASEAAVGLLQRISPIGNFYNGRSVFITGATGFLGTVLVEKLLYSCDGIQNIYVLIKQTNRERFEKTFLSYLDSQAFHRIKNKDPDLIKKIKPIFGNLDENNLGIDKKDITTLQEEVSVVFHPAAKLLFNMSIHTAVEANTRSTERLIAICKRMRKLCAFIYVSSAFSNVNKQIIDEKVYSTGVSLDTVYDTLQANNTKGLTELLLDGRPNAYTFSKALTEELVEKCFNDLPVVIVRPSIIISSVREPVPGWITGSQGCAVITAAACKGTLLCWWGTPNNIFDLIPVDYVANLLIAAAWETNERRLKGECGTKVYNCCSGLRNPIEVDDFMQSSMKHTRFCRGMLTVKRRFEIKQSYVYYRILLFIYHTIPAFLIDTFNWFIGREPRMMKALKRLQNTSYLLAYFTQHQYLFLDSNVRRLLAQMDVTDRQIFDFDVTNIDWDKYVLDNALAIIKL